MRVKEFSTDEALSLFPDVEQINLTEQLEFINYDFYISALGFEERTLSIPSMLPNLSNQKKFTCEETIYLVYNTITNDNTFNESPLREFFNRILNKSGKAPKISNMRCDEDSFSQLLSNKLTSNGARGEEIRVILDLSVCSSKLILTLLKVIMSLKNLNLTILYTEADTYYPLYEEFIKNKEKFLDDSDLSSTRGHEKTINSNEYSEGSKENPDLIVAFAPFKVGRINKIISDIDESILLNNDNRLIWIIGDPNFELLEDRQNRMKMVKEINRITDEDDCSIQNLSTINYKDTISNLDNIYKQNDDFHLNIADLGSKMQTVGISLFYHIRPDVSVYYAIPKDYNSSRYSLGIKAHWTIKFGSIEKLTKIINQIDCLEVFYDVNTNYPEMQQ